LQSFEETKRLEEEERQRRLKHNIHDHQDVSKVNRLEEEERRRRIHEGEKDVRVEKQLSNQNRKLTEHLEEQERARRMLEETKLEEKQHETVIAEDTKQRSAY
jgi:hypothetical protein